MKTFDVVIVGAGIVGLATAWQLLRRRPGLRLCIIEKEEAVAQHQSSNNSGVIHSGIYYKPGSQKALNCLRGYRYMLDFCQEQDIPFDICGKVIVATDHKELPQLEAIFRRGQENGLEGLRKISPEEVAETEPYVQSVAAIHVPQTGIVNYGTVAQKLYDLCVAQGMTALMGEKVTDIRDRENEVLVLTERSEVLAKQVVTCGGLYADKLANMTLPGNTIQILPFRGEYYDLIPSRQHLVSHLVYPVPNPDFPFLGVHFTRMIEGGVEAGPNAVLAFQREGYSLWDINLQEMIEAVQFSGFRKIVGKYWKEAADELYRSASKAAFVKSLQKLVPAVRSEDLVKGRSGVRAMACDPDGNLIDDFLFLSSERTLHVVNAPSPAATASLSIGETIAEKILEKEIFG